MKHPTVHILLGIIGILVFVSPLHAQKRSVLSDKIPRSNNPAPCYITMSIDQSSTYVFGETMDLVICGDIEAETDCGDGKKSQTLEILLYSIFPAGAQIFADFSGSLTFTLNSSHPQVQGQYYPVTINFQDPFGVTEHFLISTDQPVTIDFIECNPLQFCANSVAGIDFNPRTKNLVGTLFNGSGNYQYDWELTHAQTGQQINHSGPDRIPLPCDTWEVELRVTDLADGCVYTHTESFSFEDCGPKPPSSRLSNQTSDFGIFPNPTRSDFVLQHSYEGGQTLSLEILDMRGKQLHVQDVLASQAQTKIKLQQLPPGMYFVKVLSQDQTLYLEKLLLK